MLAAMVAPRVAAAAAEAAIGAIAEVEPALVQQPIMEAHHMQSTSHLNVIHNMQDHTDSFKEQNKYDMQRQEQGSSQGEKAQAQEPSSISNDNTDGNSKLPLAFQARVAVATALGVAAANANLLADQEELEIDNLVASIIDTQVEESQHFVFFMTVKQRSGVTWQNVQDLSSSSLKHLLWDDLAAFWMLQLSSHSSASGCR
jgi:SWI/SNF related-matrix-associated actin-dependent regulator of chromatin subfamily C